MRSITSVSNNDELVKASDRLKAGDVVAMPTETVYGLAASIDSEAALRKVFSLKKRPFFDPLIVHVASFREAASVVKEWSPLADFLARFFWPGPFTLVLPKAERINPLITSGLETVAVRYPAHPLAQELIRLTGTPLAAPSANQFGRTSPSTSQHVRAEFPDEDLLILDGGECEVGVESTVVSLSIDSKGESEVLILRPGGITEEQILNSLRKWSHPVSVKHASSEASPGHLKHHYMPKIPLVIVKTDEPLEPSMELSKATLEKIRKELKIEKPRSPKELLLNEDATIAARELYSAMRALADSGADLLFVRSSSAPESRQGLWRAIWDRLERASSLDLT